MKKAIYFTAILGFGALFNSIQAAETEVKTPEQEAQEIGAAAAAEHNVAPGVMSAWLIESGQAAKDYVEGIDKGQYGDSWSNADQLFQHTITKSNWEKALSDNRTKLGKLKSRSLKRQVPAWDPKGLPKGVYMVVEYNTSFENAPNSGETLTLRRGTDDKWRVLTYQVN